MTVYLDPMVNHGKRIGRAGPSWCHMIADSFRELHVMARVVGLKLAHYQAPPRASFPHYDIGTERVRAAAIKAGAIDCDRRTFVGHLQRIRIAATGATP